MKIGHGLCYTDEELFIPYSFDLVILDWIASNDRYVNWTLQRLYEKKPFEHVIQGFSGLN